MVNYLTVIYTSELTSVGVSLGTPAYMAPEQAAADPAIDHRADIYSIGVMAYEMLSGTPPFTGAPQSVLAAHITGTPRPLLEARPDVPPAVAKIVMQCLEKDPARRFQTADELLVALESLVTPTIGSMASPARAARPVRRLAMGGIAVAALGVVAVLGINQVRRDRWVHQVAIPELRRLVEAAEVDSAFDLALQAREAAPRDSILNAIWLSFTQPVVIRSSPEGVSVHRASTADTSRWHLVGTTPTDTVRLPNGVALYRFEKGGFRTAYSLFHSNRALVNFGYLPAMELSLDSVAAPHPEMARVPGGHTRAFLVGADGATPLQLAEYRMDRFEVSNSAYKDFVDAGGYANHEFWEHEFEGEDGRPISFEAAMARFTDRTGRPGPATWEAGTFPQGGGDLPVGGVSWYEAAAYAKFAGKSLPTIYHWARAASAWNSKYVVPLSNLDGNQPLPTGTARGVSVASISDLAGNVREWCLNDAGRGQRFILGGGWSDPRYAFVDAYAQPPMDRSAINGIRLVLYDPTDTVVAQASQPIPRAFTDYRRERPVSDAVYAGFVRQFDYDPAPLDAQVEVRDSTPEDWIAEKVSFNAAYGGERMLAWVYLPRNATPPYQTVVLFPGSGAIGASPTTAQQSPILTFAVPSGRAVVYPVYKSTHERGDSLRSDIPDQSIFWRDHVVMWVKDFRRTLDYLGTRAEVDTSKFAYFGFSWGGYMGGIIPAVEPRIKASMLYVAGLTMERGRPEVEPINHLPRISTPVLMLNGKYDFFFPLETAQKPFFEFLGTPAEHKQWIVYEGGHDVPRTELIKQSLAWLDRYLGPVR
jgi:dienelactone hydrolase